MQTYRAVNLCAVFSGKSSAAMTRISSVGVYNDFSSRQSAVSMRAANHKTACGVDIKFCILIYHFTRQDFIKYIFFDVCMNLFLRDIRIMLCGKHYCIQPDRFVIFIILNSYLSLSIRS